jgi:thioredoxin-like negative regulator of GroEL
MSGRPAPAFGAYQNIHLNELEPDPLLSPNDQSLNSKAGDEAFYWEAQAKFDDEDFETAATAAKRYIAAGGDRSDESAGLIALCLAAEGKTDEAAKAIDALPETTPGLPRLKWLAIRWRTPAEE